MTLTRWDVLLIAVLNLLFWIAASFLKPYLRRKGENLATHEDIQKLVDQVKATTAATEAIKSELSGRLWVSQEQWKLKTDLYVSLLTMLHRLMDEAGKGIAALASGKPAVFTQQDISGDLRRMFVLMQIVSPQVVDALQGVRNVERHPGVNDTEYFEQMYEMYQQTYFQVAALAREDLGFAPTRTS
jgi:hypothetical protein